jgi:glycosyltransferase involved in cell wall biosynthesis
LASVLRLHRGAIGLSLLQAFGYGLPVVTHDRILEHNPEIAALEDGGSGLLFPRGDAPALARRLAQLCADEPLRLRLSARALETVTRTYTLENMVARFVDAMHGTARLRRGRHGAVAAAR